jgi:hypothetical protein
MGSDAECVQPSSHLFLAITHTDANSYLDASTITNPHANEREITAGITAGTPGAM